MRTIDSIYKNKKQIFINNLIGGLAWAIGATVGLTIILAIASFIFKNVTLIPFVGEFISSVIEDVLQKNPQLLK